MSCRFILTRFLPSHAELAPPSQVRFHTLKTALMPAIELVSRNNNGLPEPELGVPPAIVADASAARGTKKAAASSKGQNAAGSSSQHPKAPLLQHSNVGRDSAVGPLQTFEEAVAVHLLAKRQLIQEQCGVWVSECQKPAMKKAMEEVSSQIRKGFEKLTTARVPV